MINLSGIPKTSSLIDEGLKEQLTGIFSRMPKPVVLKAVVDMKQEKDAEMASFLHAISQLGSQLSVELYTPAEAASHVPDLDTSYLPVTGFYKNGQYRRVAFHGVPGGKEINSFILAILNLSGDCQDVPEKLKKRIGTLKKASNIKICVSLSCHHCPAVVTACQQIAILSPGVEAEMIDAALYPELVKKFNISRVPMIITDDRDIYMGSKTIEEIVNLLKF
ncbi:MAG: thioredoxin family protein [Lacrimispora sp.]|uniref:thioredoxin family protein n=1 Tax=Lacrimispora sp. TaxID=2719234 RepID=UPI0039E381FB